MEALKFACEHDCAGAWEEWWRRAFPRKLKPREPGDLGGESGERRRKKFGIFASWRRGAPQVTYGATAIGEQPTPVNGYVDVLMYQI